MFDFSKKLAFGLDLSDRSLKIVQFEKQGDELSLSCFIKKDIPKGIVQEGLIKNEEELVNILKNSLREIGGGALKNKRVVCSLPEEKVFIRVIQLPLMKEEEVANAVHWEAEAHIPLSVNEVYMDWQIIEPITNHLNHIDILVAAVPRDLVRSYLSFLKKSGLQPIALEPESVAVVRSLMRPNDNKPTIIIDLGATGTNFVVFSAGAIRFTSHIRISGQLLRDTLVKDLKVDKKEAQQLKIKVGLDKTKEKGKVHQALKPVVDDLIEQISEYIDFYHNNTTHIHAPKKKIEQVLLCGGDSLLINFSSYLEQRLKISVEVINPLKNILTAGVKSKTTSGQIFSKKNVLIYNTAIGLALNEND